MHAHEKKETKLQKKAVDYTKQGFLTKSPCLVDELDVLIQAQKHNRHKEATLVKLYVNTPKQH
jgi:hypothetical protein